MTEDRISKPIDDWNGTEIPPGASVDVKLAVSESYSSMTLRIPIHVRRAEEDGPVIFVTAALHGDEINGTGAIRHLIMDDELQLDRGALVLIPVLNLLAFDRHSRYLPDRRDLNRSFPGSLSGSLARRMAHKIFTEIVSRCDYGIDLHTAAVRRTNYPTIRADLSSPEVKKLAEAFGSEVMMNGKGPRGSFRREACLAGCPVITMEGGEVWKVEPSIVESSIRGIKNVLRNFEMLSGDADNPGYQIVVERSKWVRADRGGFLQFHVKPGDVIEADAALATNSTLLGRERSVLRAPFNAVVIGMTTLPAVSPGEAVCHLAELPDDMTPEQIQKLRTRSDIHDEQIAEDLSTNIVVTERQEEDSEATEETQK